MASVLIIDDEEALVSSLSFALRGQGYQVDSAGTGEAGLRAVERQEPLLVLLDVNLPDGSGLDWLQKIKACRADVPVIMISARGETRAAVKSVKSGAFDYLTKPFELDDLLLAMRAALERERMTEEISRYREAATTVGQLIGDSETMQRLVETVRRTGESSASRVLILGESGTGKALVARAIHRHSALSAGPFIEVNCASLPEHLIEAELFGAEKGAYTGAHHKRVGLVTLADGGTLFLDEVGELPLPLQAKLLHFLEDGSYRTVGSSRALVSHARVLAATNRELTAEVKAGTFREDLYYRLAVVQVRVPPLRERQGDVLGLARHFAARYARDEKCAPVTFTPEAEAVLLRHPWPGNVRELRNLLERLTILAPGRSVGPQDLPAEMAAAAPAAAAAGAGHEPRSISAALADTEQRLLEDALREATGHRGRAAAILGISRHALKRRLQKLGLL